MATFKAEQDLYGRRSNGVRYLIMRAGTEIPLAQAVRYGVADRHGNFTGALDGNGNKIPAHDEVNATDAAVELAAEHGVILADIEGTGEDGRVLVGDVRRYIEALDEEE